MTPDFLLPADEGARLRTLHQYAAATLLREPIFDELVHLTAQLFGLPISLISLLDANEVGYLASEGVPGLARQPRVAAICALAVRDNKTVVFADLTSAEQQRLTAEALLAVRANKYRFYAGVPLRMPDKLSIGTLCVVDYQPRDFSPQELLTLEKISEIVAQTLVARHYCLTAGLGPAHWQTLQAELVEQISALSVLVRYTITRLGAQVPVAPEVLGLAMRRLQDLHDILREYLQSKVG